MDESSHEARLKQCVPRFIPSKHERTSRWEADHVHKVYNLIAPHYNEVKYRTWPKVNKFLNSLAPGSLVADVGCANGRYLSVNPLVCKFGSDICLPLLEQARGERYEVLAADNMALPFRDNIFDAVFSIGVIHHFSSQRRRIRAVRELARITSPGGKLMIYVWSFEQTKRKFTSQEVLIPWIQPIVGHRSKDIMELNKNCSEVCPDNHITTKCNTDPGTLDSGAKLESNKDLLCEIETTKPQNCRPISTHSAANEQHGYTKPMILYDDEDSAEKERKDDGLIVGEKAALDELSVISETDIDWTPETTETSASDVLTYPNQLVAECKKLGRLLRYVSGAAESCESLDTNGTPDEMFADDNYDFHMSYETSIMKWLSGLKAEENDLPNLQIDNNSESVSYCDVQHDRKSVESSASQYCDDNQSTLPNTTSHLSKLYSDTDVSDNYTSVSDSNELLTEDTTVAINSISSDSSSLSLSNETEVNQNSNDIIDVHTSSRKSAFCPFSMTPPEIPSDASLSDSSEDVAHFEINSKLAGLNVNGRYCCSEVQTASHCPPQSKTVANDNKREQPSKLSQSAYDSALPTVHYSQNDSPISSEYNAQSELCKTRQFVQPTINTHKNKMSQTNKNENMFFNQFRQNVRYALTKISDNLQTNRKQETTPATQHHQSARRNEGSVQSKKQDEITLQYYREVCHFPNNEQYNSMRRCLNRLTPAQIPQVIHSKKHKLLHLVRRLSGEKEKMSSSTKLVPEQKRKLSLSDALTMIGEGISEDTFIDQLENSAKTVFLEMRKLNFGIRKFPESSLNNKEILQEANSRVNINNSLGELKDNFKEVANRAVESLQNGLTKIGQDALKSDLSMIAPQCNEKKQLAQINGSIDLLSLSGEGIRTNTLLLGSQVGVGINFNQQTLSYECQKFDNKSNNANCEHQISNLCTKHPTGSVDNLLSASLPGNGHYRNKQLLKQSHMSIDSQEMFSSLSRYYHVFRQSELEELIRTNVPSLSVVETSYDHANWCIIAQKL